MLNFNELSLEKGGITEGNFHFKFLSKSDKHIEILEPSLKVWGFFCIVTAKKINPNSKILLSYRLQFKPTVFPHIVAAATILF